MKTTKGGKVMNPTDAYRKELRKKELKRNKKERKKVREVGILKKDPETLKEQIDKLEAMKADGALDKARKHKKRQLEDTLNLVLKKRKEYEEKMKEKGEAPVMFSHLGPPRRRTTEEEERAKHPKPEDSVYYHPQWNPTGAPPPGKPPMFKSSIGPIIPLMEGSSSAAATNAESDDVGSSIPPPPPPPPLPQSGDAESTDDTTLPASLPLPPPPPMPPKPATSDMGTMSPLPPGPPSKEQVPSHLPLPPPPPRPQSTQPPPPGTAGTEKSQVSKSDDSASREAIQAPIKLPPPPPPPGLPPKLTSNQSEGASETKELPKMVPPPPPPRQPPPLPEMLPPGISRFPPPPPPPLSALGIPGQPPPLPGMMPPMIPRPPFGPAPMMRPPLPPGPPPVFLMEDQVARPPTVPQKPSYVKSAASTVVKRPLAQHTPQLTAMVPASVRVRRESAAPKAKPKQSVSSVTVAPHPAPTQPVVKQPTVKVSSSSAAKPPSVDDSYMAFLEDMKALGALDN